MQRHSLIIRVGEQDTEPVQNTEPTAFPTDIQLVDLTRSLGFGIGGTIQSIQEQGVSVSPIGIDLLVLASAVYAADKRINRNEVSQDGWTREIDIHLPVSNPSLWNTLQTHIEKMLGFLTGDLWRVKFRQQVAKISTKSQQLLDAPPTNLCLFSGGLDSFIGAIDLLEAGQTPILVSHSWVSSDSNHQTECLNALRAQFGNDRFRQVRSRIGFGEQDLRLTTDGENTERSRSFLFFSIAAASASGLETPIPTIVPENGLISLNIPLDPLRLGAFSTRTTHPYFIARYNELLAGLSIPTHLSNPYRHKTKGEMVAGCQNPQLLTKSVNSTVSCSSENKARWQGKTPGHCGHCVPCLIRRAALLRLQIPDPTTYTIGALTAKSHPSNKAEGEHIRSFQIAIHRLKKNRKSAFILAQKAGSLLDHPNELDAFADLYCRGLDEVEQLLRGVTAIPDV